MTWAMSMERWKVTHDSIRMQMEEVRGEWRALERWGLGYLLPSAIPSTLVSLVPSTLLLFITSLVVSILYLQVTLVHVT